MSFFMAPWLAFGVFGAIGAVLALRERQYRQAVRRGRDEARGFGIDLGGAGDRDAELVFRLAGGNLFMGLGVDIRVDPHRHRGSDTHGRGDF